MCNVTLNEEKQGIEVRFDSKPSKDVLAKLKESGFRWSNRQKMWYAKQSAERLDIVNSLSEDTTKSEKVVADKVLDLWGLTRIDNISEQPGENLETKEIAAAIRKHLRSTFPMFKFSVTSDYDSISAYITASPYEKDSDEVKEMLEYMGEYIESYKKSSRYSFYGGRRYPQVSYDCKYREMTVSDLNVREKFQQEKHKWEIAEEERKAAEFEAYKIRAEKERIESERLEKIRKENYKIIMDNIEVKDIEKPYFIVDLIESWRSKEDNINGYDEYEEDEEPPRRVVAEVTREVYMTEDVYNLFTRQLLDDYDFLKGMGGSETLDKRIKSMLDYDMMSEAERNTVNFYSCNTVAVYCNGTLRFVIDPQGFSYARYCFIMDEQTKRVEEYVPEQLIDDEELEELAHMADTIEDASTTIITQNEWIDTWNSDKQLEYIAAMKEWVYSNNFKLTKEIVRQVSLTKLKPMLYRVLDEVDCITEQFTRANLTDGQRITIMRIGDFGGFNVSHVTLKSIEIGRYAQYDKAVKLVFIPERKRKAYFNWYYSHMIVVDGWVNLPESLFWNVEKGDGVITKMSKYLSCDRTMYDVTEEYLKQQGITPIINTWNPSNRV